jgi:hypothetical protein
MIKFKRASSNKKAFDHINNGSHRFKTGARKGFHINGKMVVNDVVTKMNQKPKSGRSYKVYRGIGGRKLQKPRLHVASSPDEYPAVITGDLRKSVDFKVLGFSRMEFGAGSNKVRYAKFLEKRNKYLRRTVRATGNQFKANLNREINKAMGLR